MKPLLGLLLVGLLLAGCSSPPTAVTPMQDSQGRYMIHMTAANAFDPPLAKVPVGATVIWINDSPNVHDVQGDSFSSGAAGAMAKGATYTYTFTTAGTHDYFCTVHKGVGMSAKIVVG